jgi:outer membrane protein assembly factor BamA
MLPHAMMRPTPTARLLLTLRVCCALLGIVLSVTPAAGQQELSYSHPDLVDRPVTAVEFQGLKRVTSQEIRNNIRASVGEPFDPRVVAEDVRRLTRLGQFKSLTALGVLNADG